MFEFLVLIGYISHTLVHLPGLLCLVTVFVLNSKEMNRKSFSFCMFFFLVRCYFYACSSCYKSWLISDDVLFLNVLSFFFISKYFIVGVK
jgi:hypothetical protein